MGRGAHGSGIPNSVCSRCGLSAQWLENSGRPARRGRGDSLDAARVEAGPVDAVGQHCGAGRKVSQHAGAGQWREEGGTDFCAGQSGCRRREVEIAGP